IVLSNLKETEGLEAIAEVLKKPEPFLNGVKKLSDRHIEAIKEKGAKLKEKAQSKTELEFRKELKTRLEADSSKEESLEVLFHRGGGRLWQIGEEIRFQGHIYKVSHVIRNPLGLKLAIFVSDVPGEKPIIACNGTSDFQNALDDLNRSIGLRAVRGSLSEIEHALHEIVQKYGPVRIGGHSLGGAIAQSITALFCDKKTEGKSFIAECHYYNAPGPGKMIYKLFLRKSNALKEEGITPPLIRSYRNEHDIIPLFGGPHLPANHAVVVSDPRFRFSIKSILESHKNLGFFTNKIRHVKSLAEDMPGSKILESIRKKISRIVLPILILIAGNDHVQYRLNILKQYFQRN
ncbi:MAG: lipase family protein, partial [Parachlamydiaceae bacterium]